MNILEIENLKKNFGNHAVLSGLDLKVEEGSVFGFIGQNGAGKTTTMKIILGLLKKDAGSVKVCGREVTYGETMTNQFVGYLPDVPEFYGYMSAEEYLMLCGRISGMSKTDIKKRSGQLLDMVGLPDTKKRISGFSRGMKQRLGLAQAMIAKPKLLICDEPTSALDPVGRKEILDIMSNIKEETTVIFSTHVLSDVERICDRVAVLHQGEIALSGSLAEIKASHCHDVLEIDFFDREGTKMFLDNFSMAGVKVESRGQAVCIKTGQIRETQGAVMELLSMQKNMPARLNVAEPTLENLFMEVTQ